MNRFVSIQIDRNVEKPLYIQIFEGLTKLIEEGTIASGEKLPPIRRMASFFNVNAVTVVNAYKQLENLGYVDSRVGSGTYVRFSPERVESEDSNVFEEVSGFSEEALESIHFKGDVSIRFDFASASIPPNYFPVKDFRNVINEVLDRDGGYALEYQESSGYQPLRESIKSFMEIQHDLKVPLDEIQIISGAQQGIDILAKAFINYRDVVFVEAPTYPGAVNAFKSRGAHIIEINMSEDGVDLKDLKENIKKNPPKLFYTMPVFQNPTGHSYSYKKRKSLQLFLKNTIFI